MKVTIGLAATRDGSVYVVACRDPLEVKAAFKNALPPGLEVRLTIREVKVGRVYRDLKEQVALHS